MVRESTKKNWGGGRNPLYSRNLERKKKKKKRGEKKKNAYTYIEEGSMNEPLTCTIIPVLNLEEKKLKNKEKMQEDKKKEQEKAQGELSTPRGKQLGRENWMAKKGKQRHHEEAKVRTL